MDLEAIGQSTIGQLVPISGLDPQTKNEWSYWAYLPDDLPQELTMSSAAVNASAKAGVAIGRLDEAVAQLPRPEIIVRPIIRREARSTSALEGTYASFEEVLEADFLERGQMSDEQREIRNYVEATEYAVQDITGRRITRTFLGELQRIIVRNTSGDTPDTGDIRPHQVAIGARYRPIQEARFVPCPPGDQLAAGIAALLDWIADHDRLPIVASMALAHYQFETLHPFGDGNGRLGRLVAILQAMQAKELRWAALNIAPYFETRRAEYQEQLLRLTVTGDFNTWIRFFADGVEIEARQGLSQIRNLLNVRDRLVAKVRAKRKGSAVEVAEFLIGYPIIDVKTIATLTNVTVQAAHLVVKNLVEDGILREVTGRRQRRLFACPEVLVALAGTG
ncbi:Fic family protein [Nocardia sp. NBC_01329]|uniref:Fic family protein n=1 Tax=Nocardia sp. NBC_01329 TaxID=2903594 RepID=UPI002E0EC080|nr:Fic family protein [Nocardia sp. NBC_01329]